MSMLRLITAPASELVPITDARAYCKIDTGDDDAVINHLITAARQFVENATGRLIGEQTWVYAMDIWPQKAGDDWWDGAREASVASLFSAAPFVALPISPVSAAVLKVLAASGSSSTDFAGTYIAQADIAPRLCLAQGATPPTPLRDAGGLEIHMTCGYSATTLPAGLRQAMLGLIAHWFEHREAGMVEVPTAAPLHVTRLLNQYRIPRL